MAKRKIKIGLVDADLLCNGTRHPNLALLKIAGFFRDNGYVRGYSDDENCYELITNESNFEELQKYNYEKGDTESLVNIPLSIPGVTYSVFMRDDKEYIKVSTRSKGDFPVNLICEKYFSGGGHKNAAGGEFRGSLQECVDVFMSILDENDKFLN